MFAIPYPIPVPMPPTKPQSQFERHWELCTETGRKRVNGVLMTAKVKEQTVERLVVEWGFDYTGPRQPLTILSPVRSDTKDLNPSAASIAFFAVGSDGFPYEEDYVTPQRFPYERDWQKKEYFLTIEKGKRTTVEVEVPIREHLNRFKDREKYPTQYLIKPDKLYIKLWHQPQNRGERLDLDAWTGTLSSEPILLDLKSW
jgi:hypothetical protein